MTYKDEGFDDFMRRDYAPLPDNTEYETSTKISQLSGDVIASGISTSANDRMSIDWNNGTITLLDGAHNRIQLGKIPGTENVYGIKIFDYQGNLVFDISSSTGNVANELTIGGDNNVKIDGANKRIIINDGTNDRILIGYQENGF